MIKTVFWVYLVFMLLFSFAPLGVELPTSDKINHFVEFFVFSILFKEAYKTSYWGNFFYSLFLSVFIEFVQYFLPYRSAEFGDVTADILGITSGLFIYFVLKLTYMELKNEE
ncbi:VanZ family protein [Persephonella atlantica]|uniref:VanZ family protein n=1 Tax=Persephonella atlantica TaxID=2699429 RepID=A0ABS1GGY7_9AQUI|nr:VanZ family protein [Persephonella atlantica]MBK3332182.1 VanZ family protein [Persephonella atlantica]